MYINHCGRRLGGQQIEYSICLWMWPLVVRIRRLMWAQHSGSAPFSASHRLSLLDDYQRCAYSRIFIPHLYLAPPQWVTPSEFCENVLMLVKLEWLGYRMKKMWRYVKPFSSDSETSGQTDGQKDLLYQYCTSVCWRAIKTTLKLLYSTSPLNKCAVHFL